MIDIKEIRKNPQKFKRACKDKGFAVDIDRLLKMDKALRDLKKLLQD
ncbi:MAG: serine--tRNA ligase, partial [Planctomycetota bacterium]